MADETTGVATIPVAKESSGVNLPAAEGTEQASATEPGEQQGQQTEPQSIPKERLDAVISQREEAKAEVSELQQKLALVQAQQQVVQQQTQSPSPADPVAEAISVIDDEYASGTQVKAALELIRRETKTGIETVLTETQFQIACPNYDELVGQPNAAGKWQPAFQSVIEKDPSILSLVYSLAPNRRKQAAYSFVKAAGTQKTPEKDAGIHPKALKALNDAAIPTSPMAITGGGALGKASRMRDMSDEEFQVLMDKHTQDSG